MSLQDDIAQHASDHSLTGLSEWAEVSQAIAAGLEWDKIIIDRADLPAEPSRALLRGGSNPHLYLRGDAESYMRWAHEFIAMALHLEARESEAAVLARRREELAAELSPRDARYGEISKTAQTAIDRIIELEDQVAS